MRAKLLLWLCALLLLGATAACVTRSDAALMRNFERNQESFEQMAQMVGEENAAKIHVFATGSDANAVLSSDGLGMERAAQYQSLVREANVVDLYSSGSGAVFDAPDRFPLFFGPVKYYLYADEALSRVTSGETGDYPFSSTAEYRSVCREMETHWYICLDRED